MAVEEKKVIVEDEFSDENYMIGDESESAYISKKGDFEYDRAESQAEKDAVTLGSGIQNMEDWQVASRQQDRLKNEAFEKLPELQKENEQLKVDNAKYKIDLKGKALPPPEKLVDVDTSSLSSFATSVGDSFMNIASVIPNKIDEIAKDPDKKKNFMRGLEIIEASSGIKPIGQATSTVGAISEGLLKAEKGFIATDIAMEKAKKQEPRRYPSMFENSLKSKFDNWEKKTAADKDSFEAVFQKYNLAKKVALDGKELPTGMFNSILAPLKKFAEEAGVGDKYFELQKKFADNPDAVMSPADQNTFNDLFQAATFQQVVQEVKKLYPVSNKDIDTLLKTKGDISTRPEALRQLIAAQMAVREIVSQSEELAYKYYEINDPMFDTKSKRDSEKMIAGKIKKDNSVADATLEKLFGTTKDVTDAGYITAFYYQQMQKQEIASGQDPYTIFVQAEKSKEDKIQDIIEKNKPKNKKDKVIVPKT